MQLNLFSMKDPRKQDHCGKKISDLLIIVKLREVDQATNSILDRFGQRSQYINIKFLFYKQSENPWVSHLHDILLLATSGYL